MARLIGNVIYVVVLGRRKRLLVRGLILIAFCFDNRVHSFFLSLSLLRTWSSMSCPPLFLKYQMAIVTIGLRRRIKSHNACQIGRLDQWINRSSRLDSPTDWLPIQSRRCFVGDQPGFIYSACLDTSPLHRLLLLLLQVLTLSFLLLHFLLWTKACRNERERESLNWCCWWCYKLSVGCANVVDWWNGPQQRERTLWTRPKTNPKLGSRTRTRNHFFMSFLFPSLLTTIKFVCYLHLPRCWSSPFNSRQSFVFNAKERKCALHLRIK